MFRRHAHPVSAWSRLISTPLLLIPLWTRRRWLWLPVGAWFAVNPVMTPPPADISPFATRAILGEEDWTRDSDSDPRLLILSGLSTASLVGAMVASHHRRIVPAATGTGICLALTLMRCAAAPRHLLLTCTAAMLQEPTQDQDIGAGGTMDTASLHLIRRVFLWTMITAFTLAAGAGILALLGLSLDDTGARVLLTTVTVGLYSLAMLCCAAVFGRPERAVGVTGVLVALLSLAWSLVMIWAEGSWIWEVVEILMTGIALTLAFTFLSLVLVMTPHRDRLIRGILGAAVGLILLATALTLVLIWWDGWESEAFPRAYGIVLILAVLAGVVTPLLSALRRRTASSTSSPSSPPGINPETSAALQAEAQRRGVTVAQLVAPLLEPGPRPPTE